MKTKQEKSFQNSIHTNPNFALTYSSDKQLINIEHQTYMKYVCILLNTFQDYIRILPAQRSTS